MNLSLSPTERANLALNATRSIPTVYAREPIGANGALEATQAIHFCSTDCREQWQNWHPDKDGTDAAGMDGAAELVDGEVCNACGKSLDLSPANGFDYKHQAWVVNGRYVACGHLQTTPCDCYGRTHEGESPAPDADIR